MPDNMSKINFNERAGIYEISCSLFSLCNLKCKFCFQDHTNRNIDVDAIMKLPAFIVDIIKQDIVDYDINKKFYIRIYGGEPFTDILSDQTFQVYRDFCNDLRNKLNDNFPGRDIEIYWGSNGVFTFRKRVETLLRDTGSFIALSYDTADRFSDELQKDIWQSTLNYFYTKGLVSSVSIMLIKPMLRRLFAGDRYFNSIPKDISIDVNQYISNPGYEKYLMSDDEIFIFYKWCIDNLMFNVDPINNLITNYVSMEPQRHCYCKCSNFFNVNEYHTKNCVDKYSKLPSEDFYGEYSSEVTEENCTEVKNCIGLQKRGCLLCENYSYCPTMCWSSIIFKDYKITTCPYQRLYDHLKNNPKLIEYFKEWSNERENS